MQGLSNLFLFIKVIFKKAKDLHLFYRLKGYLFLNINNAATRATAKRHQH